jgi:putative transposase
MAESTETLIIHEAFRFELDPNREQLMLLAKSVGASRYVYNWGLAESQRCYKLTGKGPKLRELESRLVELKKGECPWLYEISAHIGQQALRDLDYAFERFFKSVNGEGPKSGFPRFKRKGERDSARLYEVRFDRDRHIRLPMIGWVRLKETRRERCFEGRILSATIRRRADRWFVSLCVERERTIVPPKPVRQPTDVVGVDLGLRAAAVINDGSTNQIVEPRQALRENLKRLRRLNRQLARRQKGSQNREKAKLELARLHYRISCQRQDHLHQLSSSLAKTKSVIVLEDLYVRGMQRNRHLALSIGDAGMGELRRQLVYKCEWYGSTLVIADRFYPSSKTCSGCGVIKDSLRLSERLFDCDACGLLLDRDENAARNLRKLGLCQLQLPEGLREVTPVERKALAPIVLRGAKPASAKQEASEPLHSRRVTQRREERLAGVATSGPNGSAKKPHPREGLLEVVEQQDAVHEEENRHDDRVAREVPLDYVSTALRGRREAHPAHAGVAAAVHEHEADEAEHEQHLDDCEKADHRPEG